jgi:hypothetical protein
LIDGGATPLDRHDPLYRQPPEQRQTTFGMITIGRISARLYLS